MAKLDNILVYHWNAWEGFLISHLTADYCCIEAAYDDDFSVLSPHLTPNIEAVLFQINLSDSSAFPACRASIVDQLKARNITVLNVGCTDITKNNLHRQLARAGLNTAKAAREGPAEQSLFIKSNLNWGGEKEKLLPPDLTDGLRIQQSTRVSGWNHYYRTSRQDVNPALWDDDTLVIEQCIENPEQSFYRVYGFGDAIVLVKAHSPALIKKIINDPRDINTCLTRKDLEEPLSVIPEALRLQVLGFITHYPLDYFCLDIVHDLNRFYIIDLNLTPYSGKEAENSEAVQWLVAGARQSLKTTLQQEVCVA